MSVCFTFYGMNDFNSFLNWYLGGRTHIKRGLFNILFFLAFIPVLFVKMNNGLAGISEKSDEYAPLIGMIDEFSTNTDNVDTNDVDSIENYLDEAQRTRDITRQVMKMLDFNDTQEPKTLEPSWGSSLNFLIFLALIPIVQMRLRDMGKWGAEVWVYTGLIYGSIVLDSLTSLISITFPFLLTATASVLTFILISWVCVGKTSNRANNTKNYMPGDSPNDPY